MDTPAYREAERRIAERVGTQVTFYGLGLTVLPPIPEGIQILNCTRNALTRLPPLPASLQHLHCSNNQLTELPPLEHTQLTLLVASLNQLESLPTLPGTMRELLCGHNRIRELPNLREQTPTLQRLVVTFNGIQTLPPLPDTLTSLFVSSNPIQSIEVLPPNLLDLDVAHTRLTTLPNLPATLRGCDIRFCPLIEPFNEWRTEYFATGDITTLRENIDRFWTQTRGIRNEIRQRTAISRNRLRNLAGLRQTLASRREDPETGANWYYGPSQLPELVPNTLDVIGSFLSGKPKRNLNAQIRSVRLTAKAPATEGGRRKAMRRKATRKQKGRGGGKATLNSKLAPANPYGKDRKLERTIFGEFVNWFFFSRGPFPDNSANDNGFVPLSRFLSTRTFKNLEKAYPAVDLPTKVKEVLGDAFELKTTESGETLIKAVPWAGQSFAYGL